MIFLVNQYFKTNLTLPIRLGSVQGDALEFIATKDEPTTDGIDQLVASLIQRNFTKLAAIVGMTFLWEQEKN